MSLGVGRYESDTFSIAFVASKIYDYDLVKQIIIEYQINKMLTDDIFMLIDSLFGSPATVCRNTNMKSSDELEAIDYY